MKKALVIGLVLLSLMLLVGCSSEEAAVEEKKSAPMQDTDSVVMPTGVTHQVVIEDMQFMPTDLEINAGDTVEWVNKDIADHTVTLENGDFDANLPSGATGTHTFLERGPVPYFCQFHPGMRGLIVVN